MPDDLVARGVENRRLALDDRHERIPPIPHLEEHLTDLGAALLAVAPQRLELPPETMSDSLGRPRLTASRRDVFSRQ